MGGGLSERKYGGGGCSGARSIKPLEGSRPRLRRTRALCKFNCGKVRCPDSPGLCKRAQQTAAREKGMREVQNCCEGIAREKGKRRFVEGGWTERFGELGHRRSL